MVAQILLTGEDVDAPVRAEHLHNTFESLLELGIIPVVNENDSVSSAEIETGKCKVLGDNDTLSAMVARLCRADLLVFERHRRSLRRRSPCKPLRPAHPPGGGRHTGAAGHGRRSRVLARHRGMATKLSAAEPLWAQAWTWSSPMAPAPRTSTA